MEGIVAPFVIRKERDMAGNTIAQMTQSEFKEMLKAVVENTVEQKLLEILGDPDEGLQIKESVRDRLQRQRETVASRQYGQSFEGVAKELGLD
jgi:hypothetical protein